jgi:chromosome segregation ATPase
MTARALTYAEKQLGVHAVWHEVQAYAKELDDKRQQAAHARSERSELEEKLAHRETVIAVELRGEKSDLSQAAFDRELKNRIRMDSEHADLRLELGRINNRISFLEADAARARIDVEMRIARMNELGGYFAYLASVKNAETTSKSLVGDWPGLDQAATPDTPVTPATPMTPATH